MFAKDSYLMGAWAVVLGYSWRDGYWYSSILLSVMHIYYMTFYLSFPHISCSLGFS